MPAERVVRALDQVIEWRGKPRQIPSNNGPEYIRHTLASWAEKHSIELKADHDRTLILSVTIVLFVMIGLTNIYLVALLMFRKRQLNGFGFITTKDLIQLLAAFRHAKS